MNSGEAERMETREPVAEWRGEVTGGRQLFLAVGQVWSGVMFPVEMRVRITKLEPIADPRFPWPLVYWEDAETNSGCWNSGAPAFAYEGARMHASQPPPPAIPQGKRTWQQERADVVAWHREQVNRCLGVNRGCLGPDGADVPVGALWLVLAEEHRKSANLIERGDHQSSPSSVASRGDAGKSEWSDVYVQGMQATLLRIGRTTARPEDAAKALSAWARLARKAVAGELGNYADFACEANAADAPDAPQGSVPVARGGYEAYEDPRTGEMLYRPRAPAAPQGSPLPGEASNDSGPGGRAPLVGGVAPEYHPAPAGEGPGAGTITVSTAGISLEGGALEGERIGLLEKLVAAQDKLLVAYRLGASRSPGKAIDDIRRLKERLAASQPPPPAIPQGGDAAKEKP